MCVSFFSTKFVLELVPINVWRVAFAIHAETHVGLRVKIPVIFFSNFTQNWNILRNFINERSEYILNSAKQV
jgi:hypothetical protein